MAEVVATAIVHCHLRTLDRLGIDYDLLTRESEILHLKFWDAAFEMLKQRGAIQFATAGKNAGCWVMQLPSEGEAKEVSRPRKQRQATRKKKPPKKPKRKSSCAPTEPSPTSARTSPTISGNSACSPAIFITSRFHTHPDGHEVWVTTSEPSDAGAPAIRPRARSVQRDRFAAGVSAASGRGRIARARLHRASGPPEAFCLQRRGAHAALRPRNGLRNSAEEDAKRPYVEVSGRKGQGVKADDLLDRSKQRAREVDARHPTRRNPSAPPSRTPSPSARCAIFCCASRARR